MKKIILLTALLFIIMNCFSQSTNEYIEEGKVNDSLKNYTQAIVAFNKAIKMDPKNAEAYD